MRYRKFVYTLAAALAAAAPAAGLAGPIAGDGPAVVIIRHGEKPDGGGNLSCRGENRALALPAVLYGKFGRPDFTYVPSLGLGEATKHARMFQTVSPFAIKYGLEVNSAFGEKQVAEAAEAIRAKSGTVLVVWSHKAIPKLAEALGVADPPDWAGDDFDSIWIITYHGGTAALAFDREGLQPAAACPD